MINPFESSINSKYQGYLSGLRPTFSDREFWSDVLMTPNGSNTPVVIYYLITSSGDQFVDSSSNSIITST